VPPGSPQECSDGTRDAHWQDGPFGNELMTGFLNAGSNPLSMLTVRSLADLGYVINQSDTDSYTIPGGLVVAGSALRAPTAPPKPWEHLNNGPLFGINLRGDKIRLLRNPR